MNNSTKDKNYFYYCPICGRLYPASVEKCSEHDIQLKQSKNIIDYYVERGVALGYTDEGYRVLYEEEIKNNPLFQSEKTEINRTKNQDETLEYPPLPELLEKKYEGNNIEYKILKSGNPIAIALFVMGWLTYLIGFFGGIAYGYAVGSYTNYFGREVESLSSGAMLGCWFTAAVAGTLLLAFAEIINLLADINKKMGNGDE